MADPLWGQQLTNMWMLDPTMFDPTQKSNQFSNYNNAPLPGPSYNTGAGGPTNAMGQPIPAFQAWQAANPAGMGINNTPAQPQMPQPQMPQQQQQQQMTPQDLVARLGGGGNAQGAGQYYGNWLASQAKLSPQQQQIQAHNNALQQQSMQQQDYLTAAANQGGGGGRSAGGAFNPGPSGYFPPPMQAAQQQPPMAQGGGQTGGAPNNWMAALNALSQPGNPVTPGATVPMAQGFQPAGGVNQAFLGQVAPGMNQNFLSALAAIQGRPQGQQRRVG